MATVLVERMNNYTRPNSEYNNFLLYADIDNKLKQVKIQNEELKQQLIDLQNENKLKDGLLHQQSTENLSLKLEIEQLKKRLLLSSHNNNNNNSNEFARIRKIKPRKKIGKRNKNSQNNTYTYTDVNPNEESISISTFSKQLTISSVATSIINEEQKGRKIFEGYMLKKGKFNTVYQNRYFVLYSNNILSYYQNIGDDEQKEDLSLGEINLYTIINIKQDTMQNIFHLITPKRTFTLKCSKNNEFDRWIEIIKLRVSPKVIYKGWLYKKGEKHKSWKLRYCMLCELIDFNRHYQVRYYEDALCKKYKGNINCDFIHDIKILPNTSIQQYGKDKVLQLITEQRTYVIAAKDSKSRNKWYKSLKKVLFDEVNHNMRFLDPQMPHITNGESKSMQSISLPSFPPNEISRSNSKSTSKPNSMQRQKSKESKTKKPSFTLILEPISEKHTKQFASNPVSPILQISDNNQDIQNSEWNDCFAAISPTLNAIPMKLANDTTMDHMHRLQIVLSSDEEPSISNVSSADTERLMANNMRPLSSMNRTFSSTSMHSTHISTHSTESTQSMDEFYGSMSVTDNNNNNDNNNRDRDRGISYMSDNSLLIADELMDMNDEISKLGLIIDHQMDETDIEPSVKSTQMYTEMSFDGTNGCDAVIQPPFNLYQTI